MKFRIPVSWEVAREIEIEAKDYEEACELVEDEPLPEGEYIDNSFKVENAYYFVFDGKDWHFKEMT